MLIGTGDFLLKTSINTIGAYSQMFYFAIIINFLTPLNYFFDKKGRVLPKISPAEFIPTLIGNAILLSGTLFFFLALELEKATRVAPVSSAYVGIMVILAIIFLKEKITIKQAVGVIGIIVGIMLTGFGE